jgi:hypothetical protein
MDANQSEEFRTYFLLEFTRQLIRNSASVDVFKLIQLLKQEEDKKKQGTKEEKNIREFVKEKIKKEEEYSLSVKKGGQESPVFRSSYDRGVLKRDVSGKKSLFIPSTILPERLQYLRPTPTPGDIDLGKLNTFIQDPVVIAIECNGPNQGIIIGGTFGKKETSVVLTKEEIEEIIKKFSQQTKIPLQEGFFKVALNKLIISAIYSESMGSKFVLKKMLPPAPRSSLLINNQKIYSKFK